MNWKERYANYKYIHKQGDSWVITQKGTGKVLSHHDSKEAAEASFRAMMTNKHGSNRRAGLGTDLVHMVTQMPHNMSEIANHIVHMQPVHNHTPDPNSAIGTQEYMKNIALTNHEENQRMKAITDGVAGYGAVGYGLSKALKGMKKLVSKPQGKHVA